MPHNNRFNTYRPEGFGTVVPYLFVNDPLALITFLQNAFDAEEINRSVDPDNGDIANVILKIGASCFMISQARAPFLDMRTALYLYVADVDEIHAAALANGAKEVFPPENMPYDDRQSGILDPAGNYWWISNRLVEKGYQE